MACICGGTFEVLATLVLTVFGGLVSAAISYLADFFKK